MEDFHELCVNEYPEMGKEVLCNSAFFGLKNVLIQRLLREMLSNVNGASDGSSEFTNSCHEASAKR
ncbi:hypothetical protein Ancab_004389 [Ancistrocladus abbreviatus]